jgi:cytochrome c-type biogenesis protein CcmH/NrfF
MRTPALLILVLGLCLLPASHAFAGPQDTANDIAREMVSPYCEGITLHDCPSDASRKLRARIAGWAEAGMSKDDIWEQLESEFGTDIRATPSTDGAGLWAWVIPIVATLGAVGLAVVLTKRWARRKQPVTETPPVTAEQRQRLDVELAALRDQRS